MIETLTFRPGDCQALAPLRTVRDLISVRYDMVITALSPLVHSSGNLGNDSLFMTERVVDPDDPQALPEDVPYLTGNTLRHALREALTWYTLRELDMDIGSLPVAALHFLLSGGSLGKQAASLDVKQYRWLRDIFPYVGLFGGGLSTHLMEGKLKVGHGMLMCKQNAWRIGLLCPPLGSMAAACHHAEEYRERHQGTRHDARRAPVAEHAMSSEDVAEWAKTRMQSATENKDQGSDSTQMIYGYESLIAGSSLYWWVGGAHLTPLEHSALIVALLALQMRRRIGAKSGTGHGEIRIQAVAASGEIDPLADGLKQAEDGQRLSDIAREVWGAPYAEHLKEHGDDIRSWLGSMK